MVSLYGAVERKLNIRKETFDKIISDESAKQEICEALFHCLENEPEIAETVSVLLQYIAERDEHTDDGTALEYEDVRDNYQARFFLRNGNQESSPEMNTDAEDDEGRWITTENNHKVHLNEEGEPDKGNPHVIAAMNGESGSKKSKRRAAPFVEPKKTSLTPEQRSDYSSKLSELRSKMFEEKEYQNKHSYKTKGYNPEEYKASDDRQKQLQVQSNELFKSMPVGTIITQGTNLYEKTADGKWNQQYRNGKKIERKDDDVSSFLCGAIEDGDYPPVRFVENSAEVEMVTDVSLKDEDTYRNWAKDISSMERKDLVKKAKKDPEFKAVVDSIVLYTEGGYVEQREIAEEVVKNGVENASALTIGEYANGNFYSFKDLWKEEKLKSCDTPIAEGMAHVIGAVNNSEPSTTPLFRVAQDRNIAKVGSDFEPYVPPKVGDKIRIDAPTSFTASKEVEEELSKQKMGDIIHYELEPGANALNIEALSRYKQAESLCCGEFEVVSVDVKAKAVPLFNDRDITDAVRKRGIKENEYGRYTERYEVKVKIRQVAKTEIGKREDSDNAYYDCREHFDGRMALFDSRSDADDDTEWITVNGTHIPLDEEGNMIGKIGEKISGKSRSGSVNPNKKNGLALYKQFIEGGSAEVHKLLGRDVMHGGKYDPSTVDEQAAADIDSVFSKAKKSMTVYKGIPLTESEIEKIREGESRINHSISSTSQSEQTAREYANNAYDIGEEYYPVRLKVHIEPGTPIADTRELLGSSGMKGYEKEITVGRNTEWTYGKILTEETDDGPEYTIDVTVRPARTRNDSEPVIVDDQTARFVEEQLGIGRDTFLEIISDESSREQIYEALLHCVENVPELSETAANLLQLIMGTEHEDADPADADVDWITIKGTHVPLDDEGDITGKVAEKIKETSKKVSDYFTESSAPSSDKDFEREGYHKNSEGHWEKSKVEISDSVKPKNSDYDFNSEDTFNEFQRKNAKKLLPIFKQGGKNAVRDEYHKFLMQKNTKNLQQISKEDAEKIIAENISSGAIDQWYHQTDSKMKPGLVEAALKSPEVRNAALNLVYAEYTLNCEQGGKKPLSFEDFLTTPIDVYRGGHGQKHIDEDVFSSYSFDKATAERYAGNGGTVTEAKIRPIDTFGTIHFFDTDQEIWVPRELAPNGEFDSGDDARADDEPKNDEDWVTIKGTHVLIDENGVAQSGGKLKGQTFKNAKSQKKSGVKSGALSQTGPDAPKRANLSKLPLLPKRPRRKDFDTSTEEGQKKLEEARAEYRAKVDSIRAEADRVVEQWKSEPRKFSTPEQMKSWGDEHGVQFEDDILQKIDPLLYDEIVSAQQEMFERFPEVKAYQDSYRLWRNGADDQGGFMSAGAGINFCERFRSADYVYGEVVASQLEGYTTRGDGTLSTMIRHEYGHTVDAYCRSAFTTLNDTYEDHLSGRTAEKQAKRQQYEKELVDLTLKYGSEYSQTNTAEAFAEGFAEYSSNPDSEYGKVFGEFLKRWYPK